MERRRLLPSEGASTSLTELSDPGVEEKLKEQETETRLGICSDSKLGLGFSLLFLLGPVSRVPLQHRHSGGRPEPP